MRSLEKLLLDSGKSKLVGAGYLRTAFAIIESRRQIPVGLYQLVAKLEGKSYDAIRKGISWIAEDVWNQLYPERDCPSAKEFIENLWDYFREEKK